MESNKIFNIFFIFSLALFLNASLTDCAFIKVDCKDNELNLNCQCTYDKEHNYLLMTCKTTLETNITKFPAFSVDIMRIANAYDHWPVIPAECQNLIGVSLEGNQIDSIGDLKNLVALQYLNLSHNQITKIDSSIAKLKDLSVFDLSFNLLEEVHFEDFVMDSDKNTFDPKKEIFSKLELLLLNGNRIKQFYNLDVAFVGMPILSIMLGDGNMLTSIEIPGLSQYSLNIIAKAKQASEMNDTYLQFVSTVSQSGYYFGFNANSITRVHINFQALLNEIFLPYKINFLTRFLAISVKSESVKIDCDCEIYSDLNFLINQLVEAFGNEVIPYGDIENFVCFKPNSGSSFSLFTLINQDDVKKSDFCDEDFISSEPNENLSTVSTSKRFETTLSPNKNTERSSSNKNLKSVKILIAVFVLTYYFAVF